MAAYYNEHDLFAAQWLRNLIAAGHIAPGEVDTRSIEDVTPDDLRGFQQCHFFAGIGIWSRALRDAGWPDDRMAWTGSCPCQPFSAAGKGAGFTDERHLWPAWHHLIEECRPPVMLGEQVASALAWLDLVSADMEAAGYAFGANDLCAAGFGGAHIRQRLYFVGVADGECGGREGRAVASARPPAIIAAQNSKLGGLAEPPSELNDRSRSAGQGRRPEYPVSGAAGGLADNNNKGLQGSEQFGAARSGSPGQPPERGSSADGAPSSHAPLLERHAVDWLYCRDAKWRPVEPGTFPLADAAPQRVGRLRAYGNGLDLETATGFVGAVMDALGSS